MKKLISIFLLVFFFNNTVKSNEDFLTLQCQSENPDLKFLNQFTLSI